MIQRTEATRIGRNDPCPCGSGRKFKKCCWVATNLAIAKVHESTSLLNNVFTVGEGILVKGVAFKIIKIQKDHILIEDIKMSAEDIAQLSCNKKKVKETENVEKD